MFFQPVHIGAEGGRYGSRLSVGKISLSPLWLMRGRGSVGNCSSKAMLVAMFFCKGSSGWRVLRALIHCLCCD